MMNTAFLNLYWTLDAIGYKVTAVILVLFVLIWIWVMYKYLDTSDLND